MKAKRILAALIVIAGVFTAQAFAQQKGHKGDRPAAANAPATASKVDINSASEKELDTLPGVGPATAKKIIAGRPYSSVSELSRAGLKPAAIQKIAPMATVGSTAGSNATKATSQDVASNSKVAKNSAGASSAAPAATRTDSGAAANSAARGSAGPGMVWVNKDTKVYHRAGDRWYGKTKNGQYMSEADAIKAGYRDSKQNAAKK